MSRITQSNEAYILNELSYIEERLYKGNFDKSDLQFSVRTIRNLLLELYLIRQELNPEIASELDMHIKNTILASNEAAKVYESNKAF